jgi:phytoene dehydrogenase-like protein
MAAEDYDVVVAGAGLAGLTAACAAADPSRGRPLRVAVVDTRSPGGRARTDRRDGFLLNEGPHALYRGGEGRRVLGRLGIVPTGGQPPTTDALGRLGGENVPLPGNPRQLLTSPILGIRSKARLGSLLARLRRIDTDPLASTSAADWIDQQELAPEASRLVEMLMRVATYCSDLDACSADAAVSQLKMAVTDGVDYLDHGWQQLVDALVAEAITRRVDLLCLGPAGRQPGGRVEALRPDGGAWIVTTPGTELRARSVVLAVGSPAASARFLPSAPAWALGPEVTAACLDLGLRRPPTPGILFGIDHPLYLSTHCPPATLAPSGQAVVHVLRYGARAAEADAAELWEHAAAAGITEADVVTQRFLSRMVVTHALPVPGQGLAGRPTVDATGSPGLLLAGDWVGPTGMLGDASLASGEAAGAAAAAHVAATDDPVAVA